MSIKKATVHRGFFQSVKEPTNRQNATYNKSASSRAKRSEVEGSTHPRRCKFPCCARHFDLLHNSDLTVPLYAYRSELFVLVAPLTSVSLSKNKFFDKLKMRC